MNILIVDDSKAMRMIVRRALRQAGYGDHAVAEASNGIEALDAVHAAPPDLILCDWNMPEMNGLDLLERLRREGRPVKMGFVTSETSPEMRVSAETAGAAFFITKPFTPDAFRTALSPIIGS